MYLLTNRRFPEVTGKDNLTSVFLRRESEVPWMEAASERSRSAAVLDLQAWTYYSLYYTTSWGNLLSDPHAPHELWTLDRHFWCLFSVFCLRVSVIFPTCSLYPQQKRAYSVLHLQAYTGHARRHLPSAVPWISEDRLFSEWLMDTIDWYISWLIECIGDWYTFFNGMNDWLTNLYIHRLSECMIDGLTNGINDLLITIVMCLLTGCLIHSLADW